MFGFSIFGAILLGSFFGSAKSLAMTGFRAYRLKHNTRNINGMVDGSVAFLEERYKKLTEEREDLLQPVL